MHGNSAFCITWGVQISIGHNINLHAVGHAKYWVYVHRNLSIVNLYHERFFCQNKPKDMFKLNC